MMKKDLFKLLTGEHGEGRSFIASVEWVKENDPEIYEGLRDMMTQFIQDETNATDENDLTDFERGSWEVEYSFNEHNEGIEMLVTAGRDMQHIANQAAWIHEVLPLDVFIDFYEYEKYIEQLK